VERVTRTALARARVTLQDGRLITKREALEVLAGLGAPAAVLRDIYQRRYETGPQRHERTFPGTAAQDRRQAGERPGSGGRQLMSNSLPSGSFIATP
jgi:hypothetical protein